MVIDDLGCCLYREIPPDSLDKIAIRICASRQYQFWRRQRLPKLTHKVKVDAVVHQIILPGLDIHRR